MEPSLYAAFYSRDGWGTAGRLLSIIAGWGGREQGRSPQNMCTLDRRLDTDEAGYMVVSCLIIVVHGL